MKRMISLISEHVLPNFIPINEPATRPHLLHFTPRDANMVRRCDNLRNVIAARVLGLRTEDAPIKDVYNRSIKSVGELTREQSEKPARKSLSLPLSCGGIG